VFAYRVFTIVLHCPAQIPTTVLPWSRLNLYLNQMRRPGSGWCMFSVSALIPVWYLTHLLSSIAMGEAMFNSISPSTNSVLSALFILLSTHKCVIAFLTKALSMLWRPMVLLFQIPVPSIVYPFTMVNELVFELCTSSALLTHNVCFRSTQRKQYNVYHLNNELLLTGVIVLSTQILDVWASA
jgi:hypothetical protein